MTKKTVISSEFNGTKTYVSEYMKKPGGNVYVVTGTTKDPEEAYDFGSIDLANPILIRLHNPFNRQYVAHTIKVKTQQTLASFAIKEKLS